MAAVPVHTDASCFTVLVLFFNTGQERLVRKNDVHEKFDNKFKRE